MNDKQGKIAGVASLMVASVIIGGSIGLSIRAEARGCYNDAGNLVAEQPCQIAIAPDGSRQVYHDLPACEYEDGNPDGEPCLWTSKRTGLVYFNDGSNYRD